MEYSQHQPNAVGYLIVEVTTAAGALPVPDAVVTVESGGGVGDIRSTMETDRSGRTERISLPTVSAGLSQTYGNRQPYAIYDIYVTKEGYYPFRARHVPIFSGITTLQPVALIGLSANDSESVYPRNNTSVDDVQSLTSNEPNE